jgi:hypothetical protein
MSKKFLSIYVATSRGEFDPCGEPDTIKMSSIEEAVALVKDLQLDEIYQDLSNELDNDIDAVEDNWEIASEFFQQSGVLPEGEIGWVECGEEGVTLVIQEGNKWFDLLNDVDKWDEQTFQEFDKLMRSDFFS